MKQIKYAPADDGALELYNLDGRESFAITVSSSATPETAHESITVETGGNCIGPNDEIADALALILENWEVLEELSAEEAAARIAHLAEEWDLSAAELEYLDF